MDFSLKASEKLTIKNNPYLCTQFLPATFNIFH